ncbi:protein kinase [Cellulomonas sp. zg-ZUI222]|uniref:non-specific serine/threonine protein kinase n=1 Tax=Cellulomonas wangleii TaxID=2816956 RepID=A0ABX8D4M3_9CELL|nr:MULTISPECIES: serine/threonine-protein kinase [Cellulomonas]MBO0898581.1 protein kinase [Cellulomonas sp. zg-ZUI22]MBO0919443.1 protein kinase [Cellulomonas wangleii]MBO0924417.1 protein kinase [Cellulomonas wangleii]QVI62413.1 protein kinase [Cellulomonas wangleii]
MRTAPGVALGGGRYRLLRRIAVGGMGEVWEANDDALARAVAVKVLRNEFAGDAGFLERFRTEARNSAALHHPHIAALFDYGEQEGSAYLVMELVVGEPLSDLLEREPVLPPRRLLPILAQTARGLHAAHQAGVVHRDVKPGNVLLARSGRVKITDFGVSLAADQKTMTATGMVMGTAQYLSPEQAVGRPATPLSDLYSLGVVAYEALAGRRPFTGPTAVDIAVAHVNDPVPPLPASVDRKLAALVLRLLSKEPSERPASGEELAGLLDRLLPQTPPSGVAVLVSKPDRAREDRRGATGPRTSPDAASRPAPVGGTTRPGAGREAARTEAAPPSYPPSRRERAGRAAPADDGTRRGRREAPSDGPLDGVLASASGWVRRLRLPLVALVLVLVALLGAALADRLLGAGPQEPAGRAVTAEYPRGGPPGGMIAAEPSRGGLPAPADGALARTGAPRPTEVKDS